MRRLLLLLLIPLLWSCYGDKEELLYPNEFTCDDLESVSYQNDIKPILQNHCLACHSASNNATLAGGNNLEDFSVLSTLANDGTLLSAITQDGVAEPMPRNAPKLSECKLKILETWINEGANNN